MKKITKVIATVLMFFAVYFMSGTDIQAEPIFNVKNFGAFGNGVSDDTNAIQAAVNAAEQVGLGAEVFIPSGDYLISSTLKVKGPINITGASGAVLHSRLPIDDSSRYLFHITSSNVQMRGLIFDGSYAPQGLLTKRKAVILIEGSGAKISNIRITGNKFLNFTRKGAWDAKGNASLESEYGILVYQADHVYLLRNYLKEISGAGIYVSAANNIYIEENDISMLSNGDSLFHINIDHTVDGVWIRNNHLGAGSRASGGAINIMSNTIAEVVRRAYIENNLIEDNEGFGSGSAVIRVQSLDTGTVKGNIIRRIKTGRAGNPPLIAIISRCFPAPGPCQPGSQNVEVSGNVLVADDISQRGITVEHTSPDVNVGGGKNIQVKNNIIVSGTQKFIGGIRILDIENVLVENNTVEFAYNEKAVNSSGIHVADRLPKNSPQKVFGAKIIDNKIDGLSSVGAIAINIIGSEGQEIDSPEIRGNIIVRAATDISATTKVINPLIIENKSGGEVWDKPVPLVDLRANGSDQDLTINP